MKAATFVAILIAQKIEELGIDLSGNEKGPTEAEPELFRAREESIMQRQSGGGDEQQGVCMPQVAVRSPK